MHEDEVVEENQGSKSFVKAKFPTRAFPGLDFIQSGIHPALEIFKKSLKELTDCDTFSSDLETIRGIREEPHVLFFKSKLLEFQLRQFCCKPEIIKDEKELEIEECFNSFYEKKEPVYSSILPLKKANEVIENLVNLGAHFVCVVHLETEIYQDETGESLRLKITDEETDLISTVFEELSNYIQHMRFSFEITNNEEFSHIDLHEKVAMAADLIKTQHKCKTIEFLEGRIFYTDDPFLVASLSRYLQDQVCKALHKTHKDIFEKLKVTSDAFEKIRSSLQKCEPESYEILENLLHSCRPRLNDWALQFDFKCPEPKSSNKETNVGCERNVSESYRDQLIMYLSDRLGKAALSCLKNWRESRRKETCDKLTYVIYDHLLEEEIESLTPATSIQVCQSLVTFVYKWIVGIFQATTIHYCREGIHSREWRLRVSNTLYERLNENKHSLVKEIMGMIKPDVRKSSEKLNAAICAVRNLQKDIENIEAELKEVIPFHLQILDQRVPSIKGVAVLNGELKVLVEPELFLDLNKVNETLTIVEKYSQNSFGSIGKNNLMKYNSQGMKKYVEQGSKIYVQVDNNSPVTKSTLKRGTLSCFAEMKTLKESTESTTVGITNDHVAVPGKQLYVERETEMHRFGKAVGECNIDTSVNYLGKWMDFSAFPINQGISIPIEKYLFNKTRESSVSEIMRGDFGKFLEMSPKPKLYMFASSSQEPKIVEYAGVYSESGRTMDLIKANDGMIPKPGDSGSLICHYDPSLNIVKAMFIFIGSWDEGRGIFSCCRLVDCVNYLSRFRGIDISLAQPPVTGGSIMNYKVAKGNFR